MEDAEKVPSKILCLGKDFNPYWLKNPGRYEYNTTAACVHGAGEISEEGFLITAELRVRPVLYVSGLTEYDVIPYDELKLFNRVWIAIPENTLLLKCSLGTYCFRKDYMVDDANEYEASDIKKYLDGWLEKKLTQEN